MRSICLVALLIAGAAPIRAQDGIHVRWEPAEPKQGAFVFIVVEGDSTVAVDSSVTITGSLAGQPLHFERDNLGALRAMGAIPVNAAATIPVQLVVVNARNTTDRVVRVPVSEVDFAMERLSVDSRFSSQPDSALRERIRREGAMSVGVSLASHDTPRQWFEPWVRPRPGRVTSRFGTGRVFNGELRSRHMGTDLDGENGEPIRAGNRGVVALVGDFYYAGNVVYLDHGAGIVTIYMHMSEVDVEAGQVVDRGQVIGKVGATGRVTGPHLHWVGRHGRISVDPLTLLDLDPSALPPPADYPVQAEEPTGH